MRGRLISIPLDVLTKPRNGDCMVGRWWPVIDGRALFYQDVRMRGYSPQCNSSEFASQSLSERLYPTASVVYVEVAYVGRWDEEGGYMLSRDLLDASIEVESP